MDNTYVDNKIFEYMNNEITVGMSINKWFLKPYQFSWICFMYFNIIRHFICIILTLTANAL